MKFHRAPPDDVVKFLNENPAVAYNLLGRVYSGLDGMMERMFYLMAGSAINRLAVEIIIGCKRFAQKGKDGSYFYKISQQELANRTGLSRETVSRELKHLPKVEVSHGGIKVTDLPVLENFLDENS